MKLIASLVLVFCCTFCNYTYFFPILYLYTFFFRNQSILSHSFLFSFQSHQVHFLFSSLTSIFMSWVCVSMYVYMFMVHLTWVSYIAMCGHYLLKQGQCKWLGAEHYNSSSWIPVSAYSSSGKFGDFWIPRMWGTEFSLCLVEKVTAAVIQHSSHFRK